MIMIVDEPFGEKVNRLHPYTDHSSTVMSFAREIRTVHTTVF